MASNTEERIAELEGELAQARVALRASQGRERALQEALAPFAIAWPLQRARVAISWPEGMLSSQLLELLALQSFHTITVRGSNQRVHITLTGEHLKDAYEAFSSTRGRGQ